jgi:nitric oxide reductase subunit B
MNTKTEIKKPRSYKKLWLSLAAVMVASFLVLGYFGWEIYRQAPPVPKRVVTTEGVVLFIGQDIKDGQNVWQSSGGEEVGTIWGHGAYIAPDWSAPMVRPMPARSILPISAACPAS